MTKVEELLATAVAGPRAAAWKKSYEEACHQGLSDGNDLLVIPRLADIAAHLKPADRDNVLILGGQVTACH